MKRSMLMFLLVVGVIAGGTFSWRQHNSVDSSSRSVLSITAMQTPSIETPVSNKQEIRTRPRPPSPPFTSRSDISGRKKNSGPGSLSMENEARVNLFAETLATQDPKFKDFLIRAKSEDQDPVWSDKVERLFQESIQRQGAQLTGLQASVPYCTRTLCMLTATGGFSTDAANADWQRLMGAVMNESWFHQYFVDSSTSVHGDAKGVMYISYFIRRI